MDADGDRAEATLCRAHKSRASGMVDNFSISSPCITFADPIAKHALPARLKCQLKFFVGHIVITVRIVALE